MIYSIQDSSLVLKNSVLETKLYKYHKDMICVRDKTLYDMC